MKVGSIESSTQPTRSTGAPGSRCRRGAQSESAWTATTLTHMLGAYEAAIGRATPGRGR